MATIALNSNMVHWRIYYGDVEDDITKLLCPYVSSISVRKTCLPLPKNTKEPQSPTNMKIGITSPDYVEDIFVPGAKLKLTMGYSPLQQTLVFDGIIDTLPEGSARDMLNYTVKALGTGNDLSLKEKNCVFSSKNLIVKRHIIGFIATQNGYISNIDIEDNAPMNGQFIPIQKKETDLQFLMRCAKEWNCVCWFSYPRTINFVDAKKAYTNNLSPDRMKDYVLGYRTDKVPCNVETVKWKHKTPVVNGPGNPGVYGFNEYGRKIGKNEFKIANYAGRTWRLKEKWRKLFARVKNGSAHSDVSIEEVAKIAQISTRINSEFGLSSYKNYLLFKEYFEVVAYDDSSRLNEYPPTGKGSGFEITVHLNEGDPSLEPPRNAVLFAGSLNPRADSSELPQWLFSNGLGRYANLKINETLLTLQSGLLRSELICTMGKFGE